MTAITDVDRAPECGVHKCDSKATWTLSTSACECVEHRCDPCKTGSQRALERAKKDHPDVRFTCGLCGALGPLVSDLTYRFDPL